MCGSRALACFVVYVLTAIVPSFGQSTGNELFEKTIRPTLVTKCYMCHSSQLKSPMSGLVVDTKAGLLKGGARGPEIIPGKPADSRLLQALSYTDPQLQMPPTGKLDDKEARCRLRSGPVPERRPCFRRSDIGRSRSVQESAPRPQLGRSARSSICC